MDACVVAGWGEALEAEWESLHNRMTMSGEETRQLRIQIRNCEVRGGPAMQGEAWQSLRRGADGRGGVWWWRVVQDDIMKLRMERDDYEMDLDKFQMREVRERGPSQPDRGQAETPAAFPVLRMMSLLCRARHAGGGVRAAGSDGDREGGAEGGRGVPQEGLPAEVQVEGLQHQEEGAHADTVAAVAGLWYSRRLRVAAVSWWCVRSVGNRPEPRLHPRHAAEDQGWVGRHGPLSSQTAEP